ncbi:MAG: dTMP kinase [Candidatus Liptonbacteria bacterium]|nr:dTMP kinase [Candidatus Liptonbacteria bacterium]
MQGTFVVFEGPDGSGQSTQAKLLAEHLTAQGKEVVLTKEPTEGTFGVEIRKVLRGESKLGARELQELFVEDRKEHLELLILPALARGAVVISDRYFFSTIAFGSLECDFEWLRELNSNFPLPDRTFVLEVSSETCLARIEKRGGEKELFEAKEKLARVNTAYQKLAKLYENVVVIDGERPIEKVFTDVRARVDVLFT